MIIILFMWQDILGDNIGVVRSIDGCSRECLHHCPPMAPIQSIKQLEVPGRYIQTLSSTSTYSRE